MTSAVFKRKMAVAATIVYILTFSDCTLERGGLATPAPADVDFEGCFQVATDSARRIALLPSGPAALSGTARGLLLSGGWSFNGSISAPGVAALSATGEVGQEFDVQAVRRGTRPTDTLDLTVSGMTGRVLFDTTTITGLVRCSR